AGRRAGPAAAVRRRRGAAAARAGAAAGQYPRRAVAVPRRGLHPRGDRGADAAHAELLQVAACARHAPAARAAGDRGTRPWLTTRFTRPRPLPAGTTR